MKTWESVVQYGQEQDGGQEARTSDRVREEQLGGLGVKNGRIRDSEVQISCRSGIAQASKHN